MQINFTGHHLEITDALRKFTTGKIERLLRHFDKITTINIKFGIEHLKQIAEANIHLKGNKIHARSESQDMYAAIDTLMDKLDRQLIKYKEKLKNHKVNREDSDAN